jgi:YVTN family beta-propeller protein
MRIDFRILGPLEVGEGERRLPLGGQRQRALLALLLLHANEVVSRDRLIDEVWGEEPPATVDNAVQVYVSRLRKLLQSGNGGGSLSREGNGYLLTIEPEQLDANRFQQLVRDGRRARAEGDDERAAVALCRALELWRGSPLGDLPLGEFAQAEIARLEELRLSALEDRIEADLARGKDVDLVPELEALVAEHPYRERLRASLMLALYRSGRQADALDAYARTRTALDELGLEPREELRRLQTQILQHDPALDRPVPAGRQKSPTRRGRARVLQAAALVVTLIVLGAALLAFADFGRDSTTVSTVTVPKNSLVAIDPETNAVVSAAPIDARPKGIALGGGAIWVGVYDDNVVLRIDPRSHRVVRAIAVGGEPADIAAGSTDVWITNSVGTSTLGSVSRVDARTNFVPRPVRLRQVVPGLPFTSAEPGPRGVAIGGGSVWVAHSFSLVSRIAPRSASIVERILLPNPPQDVAFGSGALWVTMSGENSVARIDPVTNAVETTARIGSELDWIRAIATGEGGVWVTSRAYDSDAAGKLWRIDPASGRVTTATRVGRSPLGVAVGEGSVWVANYEDGTVSRIDPETQEVVATISVKRGVAEVAVGDGVVWATVRDPAAAAHVGGVP